jgi:hypothetical protein
MNDDGYVRVWKVPVVARILSYNLRKTMEAFSVIGLFQQIFEHRYTGCIKTRRRNFKNGLLI